MTGSVVTLEWFLCRVKIKHGFYMIILTAFLNTASGKILSYL